MHRKLGWIRRAAVVVALFGAAVVLAACSEGDDYRIGKKLLNSGDLHGALAAFQRAIEKDPNHARAWRKMGTIYLRRNEFDEAVEALRRAVELEPDDVEILTLYAVALDRAGRRLEAEDVSRRALTFPAAQRDEKLRRRLEALSGNSTSLSSNKAQAQGPEQLSPRSDGEPASPPSVAAEAAVTSESLERELGVCEPLPRGHLSDDELLRLVPDDSPGRVLIRWRTETQEDNYGFNIYRAESPDGPYRKINKSIIPGAGTTNVPRDYCYVDRPLPRGKIFYYYIESVSNSGVREILEGTKGTRVKVKTVEEEREWLRKKALGEDANPTPTTAALQQVSATTRTVPVVPQRVLLGAARFTLRETTSSSEQEPIY